MLSKRQFKKLRSEIVLNSLFYSDYRNSFGIKPATVCSFFDSAIEYIADEYYEQHGKRLDICDITTDMLYAYYTSGLFETDPLEPDDDMPILFNY